MDLIKETHRWVMGACVEWNLQMNQFIDMSSREFIDFVARTHTKVYQYLMGRIDLDGSCSDLECCLALQAKYVFQLPQKNI